MTENFKVLSDSEFDKLIDAISLITIYVAGADGEIGTEELRWAEKLTSIRSYNLPGDLKEFYKEVGKEFHERVENYSKSLDQIEVRNQTVAQKLTELNPILEKLDSKTGEALYKSYTSFAKHVAKSSGGFLGFFSISAGEKAVIGLKMINPIVWEKENDKPTENT